MERICLVEDDPDIVQMLRAFLQQEGFSVCHAVGQQGALALLEQDAVDLLLVDISLADGNGFAVCSAAKDKNLPVVFLTASGDEYSVVAGLDMGADDYVAKPFRPRELVSRIRSVLRRAGQGGSTLMEFGPVQINAALGKVYKNGQDVFLSALEYRLLMTLANHAGQVLSRNQLLESIWDVSGDFVNDNTLTVYIKRLREKIEDDPQNPVVIETARGLGYRVGGRR